MQITSDWHEVWSPDKFEAELQLKFNGPGFYLSATDTVLVTPASASIDTIWHYKQPNGMQFDVNVWNCQFNETIFSALSCPPTRLDTR